MKVPNMYKSSDRYNAGTDVIYNDGSKLQYAPFIYATTESGDNGEDDEGDEAMFVNITADESTGFATMDKTFGEIKTAVESGKLILFKWDDIISALVSIDTTNRVIYYYNESNLFTFNATGDTDYPKMELGG